MCCVSQSSRKVREEAEVAEERVPHPSIGECTSCNAGGRGRGSKRSQDDFDLAPTPAKQPRIARGDARVAASQASPQASQAPPAPPAQPCAPTAAQASTATVPPAAATPFLPRRAGAVPDAAESFLAPSQHMSQAQLQPPPKRQWALKKGS